jgi:hypothetical protein
MIASKRAIQTFKTFITLHHIMAIKIRSALFLFISASSLIWSFVLFDVTFQWPQDDDAVMILDSTGASSSSSSKTHLLQPLPFQTLYSKRPLEHLKSQMTNRSALISPYLPPLSLEYFGQSDGVLRKEDNLYGFGEYLNFFEGSVTHTWISILHKIQQEQDRNVEDYVVIDGGMNTGFYTLLSATQGFEVHSFDIQIDCFDVSQLLLDANEKVKAKLNGINGDSSSSSSVSAQPMGKNYFYFRGLWNDDERTFTVEEGCDPGRGVDDYHEKKDNPKWPTRTHNVTTTTLNRVLDTVLSTISNDNDDDPKQQQLKKKKVAILKLDIEGAEPGALMGLTNDDIQSIDNILLEFARGRMKRVGFQPNQIKDQFVRLEKNGMVPYLLYQPRIPFEQWFNDTWLIEEVGLSSVTKVHVDANDDDVFTHPILGVDIGNITKSMTNVILWRICDWDAFLNTKLFLAGNLLFTRM